MLGEFLLVFCLAIITEAFYTCYAFYVARADLLRGPLASGAIAVFKAMLVIKYVREPLMIVMLALGQIVGTYLTLKVIRTKMIVE